MLLVVLPAADVLAIVRPLVSALPMLHVIKILAGVRAPIGPGEASLALHFIFNPITCILAAVLPSEVSGPMDVVRVIFSLEKASICPFEYSLAVFGALNVVAFVARAILPRLNAVTMLLVVFPSSNVAAAVDVLGDADAARFVVLPFSFVDVASYIYDPTAPMTFIVLPEAVIARAIIKDLNAAAVSCLALNEPLALV